MDTLLAQLSDAISQADWRVVAAISVVIALSFVVGVLKGLNKSNAVLDTILDLARKVIPLIPRKAPVAPKEGEKTGVSAVVPVVKGSEDDLK